MTIQEFTIRIGDDVLEDLQRRRRATRWPAGLDRGSWGDGASVAFVRRLVDRWLSGFDWRARKSA
jgi:microsomal epoxide hydrolase